VRDARRGYRGKKVRFHPIRERDLIAEGGEGMIFNVSGASDLLAKIYTEPEKRDRSKIEAMIRSPPRDDSNPGHVALAWPVDILVDSELNTFAGFLMKCIPAARPILSVIKPSTRERIAGEISSHRHLHTAATNLAGVFAALHRLGHVVGDVNNLNVMVTASALVSLVDTDSFQVKDARSGVVFRCLVGVPNFTPPELQGADFNKIDRNEIHDRFGLAVLLFNLLMSGYHPFDGSPSDPKDDASAAMDTSNRIRKRVNFPFGPQQTKFVRPLHAPPLQSLHRDLQELFLRSFDTGMRNASLRPSAAEWRAALLLSAERLRDCPRVSHHQFDRHLSGCPYCNIDAESAAHRRRSSQTAKPTAPILSQSQPSYVQSVAPAPLAPKVTLPPPPLPPPSPPPRAAIGPGVWSISSDSTPENIQMQIHLKADGTASGQMDASVVGTLVTQRADFMGHWACEASEQILSLDMLGINRPYKIFGLFQLNHDVPPPTRFSVRLQIQTAPGAGVVEAVNLETGFEVVLKRL
jgi:DNA-binding helix-hairpin-helix protein with protein kinase domain